MIDIVNIKHGWLTLEITHNKFTISYLTDVLHELDYLIDYCGENCPNTILLDGEGKDLHLTAWLTWDSKIIIVWEEYSDSDLLHIIKFDHKEFKKQYEELKERIIDDYNENFTLGIANSYHF